MIIGIDPGLDTTAIVWDMGYTYIKTKGKKENRSQRLLYIFDTLNKIFITLIKDYVQEENWNIFLERMSFNSVSDVMSVMGEVNGVIKSCVYNNFEKEPIMVSPGSWKKVVLGKGNLNKDKVKEAVQRLYNRTFENQHLYDAWCIRKYGEILG